MIKEQYARTKEILTEKRELLELIATTLLEVETLMLVKLCTLKNMVLYRFVRLRIL